jgi:hypothetical protein
MKNYIEGQTKNLEKDSNATCTTPEDESMKWRRNLKYTSKMNQGSGSIIFVFHATNPSGPVLGGLRQAAPPRTAPGGLR